MEFSGQYLTYEEYKALGGTLDLTPFNLLEFESRRRIDIRTFNRLKNVESIPQEVKICVYKLINSASSYDENLSNIANNNVASENTDGYSVSYVTSAQAVDIINSKSAELEDIITECLLGVVVNGEHLLYCGV
jgi:hypothetical protein